MQKRLTAIIDREGNGYVALCPELDIASQRDAVEQARFNHTEVVQLFLQTPDPLESKFSESK